MQQDDGGNEDSNVSDLTINYAYLYISWLSVKIACTLQLNQHFCFDANRKVKIKASVLRRDPSRKSSKKSVFGADFTTVSSVTATSSDTLLKMQPPKLMCRKNPWTTICCSWDSARSTASTSRSTKMTRLACCVALSRTRRQRRRKEAQKRRNHLWSKSQTSIRESEVG